MQMTTSSQSGWLTIFNSPKEPHLIISVVFAAAPWLFKLANSVLQGKLEQKQDQLAREAVDNLEKLGPTFIKLGQILSIR